jgi:hypothetical protein
MKIISLVVHIGFVLVVFFMLLSPLFGCASQSQCLSLAQITSQTTQYLCELLSSGSPADRTTAIEYLRRQAEECEAIATNLKVQHPNISADFSARANEIRKLIPPTQ